MKKIVFLELLLRIIEEEKWNLFEKLGQLRNPNLDVVKEIEVTDSFLGLDQDSKECQNEEPYFNCTTRHYLTSVQKICGCLPASLGFSDKVQ